MNINTAGSLKDYKNGVFHDKQFTFVLNQKNKYPTMTNSNGQEVEYPPKETFPLLDEIYDKDLKKMVSIRYVEGAKRIDYDPSDIRQEIKTRRIYKGEFKDGYYTVDGRDTILLEFMMILSTPI